jgi:hypothetical protein
MEEAKGRKMTRAPSAFIGLFVAFIVVFTTKVAANCSNSQTNVYTWGSGQTGSLAFTVPETTTGWELKAK